MDWTGILSNPSVMIELATVLLVSEQVEVQNVAKRMGLNTAGALWESQGDAKSVGSLGYLGS